MEQKPRWAEMCAQILKQCETVRGGRESLAAFLGVHPTQVAIWLSGKSGPPRAGVEKGMGVILEHTARGCGAAGTLAPSLAFHPPRFAFWCCGRSGPPRGFSEMPMETLFEPGARRT